MRRILCLAILANLLFSLQATVPEPEKEEQNGNIIECIDEIKEDDNDYGSEDRGEKDGEDVYEDNNDEEDEDDNSKKDDFDPDDDVTAITDGTNGDDSTNSDDNNENSKKDIDDLETDSDETAIADGTNGDDSTNSDDNNENSKKDKDDLETDSDETAIADGTNGDDSTNSDDNNENIKKDKDDLDPDDDVTAIADGTKDPAVVPVKCPDALKRFVKKTTSFQTEIISIGLSLFKEKSFCTSGLATVYLIGSLYLQARGSTLQEIANSIGVNQDEARCIFKLINDFVYGQLLGLFYVGISIFADESYQFTPKFRNDFDTYIVGAVLNLDMKQPSVAADIINARIEKLALGKVSDVITTSNPLETDTKIGFSSGILFLARWLYQFKIVPKKYFKVTPSLKVKVDYMFQIAPYKYFESHELKAKFIQIPFEGENVALLLALPNHNFKHAELAIKLEDPDVMNTVVNSMTEHLVKTEIPCINITTYLNTLFITEKTGIANTILNENTINLKNAFVGDKKAALTYGYQKISIVTTPDGGLIPSTQKLRKARFETDHPFLFYLTCPSLSGVVLMAGAVVNPADMTITM